MLQSLFDSEIEFSITGIPHHGFDLTIGDRLHGPHTSETVSTMEEAELWLDTAARALFPESNYAKAVATK